ncbi:MAG TPA: hypothetical protein VHU40_00460 [Polyangia bacterium]|jgi:hypothetical protein|nr:hypothetical protein [Polyangia bacterium]
MSQYPVITGGQRIASTLLKGMFWHEMWKTANLDRASTTTLADDPDLTVSLDASATYRVEMYLHYAAIDAAKFQTAWTVPSGATGNRTAVGAGSAATDATAATTSRFGVHGFATAITYGTRSSATNQCLASEAATVFTSSAGTLALQWAQASSNATATRLGAGSYMRVRRIA